MMKIEQQDEFAGLLEGGVISGVAQSGRYSIYIKYYLRSVLLRDLLYLLLTPRVKSMKLGFQQSGKDAPRRAGVKAPDLENRRE